MKKIVFMAALLLIPSGLVFAANENAKLDKNGRNSDMQVGVTSGETRKIKCSEDGYQLSKNASYETKVSTCYAGKTSEASLSVYISSSTMMVTGYEMFIVGSDVAVTGQNIAGTVYVPSGFGSDRRYETPISSFSFTAALTAGATFYYRIDGVK